MSPDSLIPGSTTHYTTSHILDKLLHRFYNAHDHASRILHDMKNKPTYKVQQLVVHEDYLVVTSLQLPGKIQHIQCYS